MHEPAQIFCAYKKTVVRNAHCERAQKRDGVAQSAQAVGRCQTSPGESRGVRIR